MTIRRYSFAIVTDSANEIAGALSETSTPTSTQAVMNAKNAFSAVESALAPATLESFVSATDGVYDVWTVACTRANAALKTFTLMGVVFTEGTDFARGATNATLATALAAALVANTTTLGQFTVTNLVAGSIVITSTGYGLIGVPATNEVTAFAIVHTTTGVAATSVRALRTTALRGA